MKKTKLVIVWLLLAVILITGCKPGVSEGGTPTLAETETEGTAVETELRLIADGVSDYVIVRADGAAAKEIDAAVLLRDTIKEMTGAELKIKNDFDTEFEHEIIVGDTRREKSQTLFAGLRYDDYEILLDGDDLLICGGNAERTYEAVERFLSEYLSTETENVALSLDLLISERSEYLASNVLIGETDLSKYCIVYPVTSVEAVKHEAVYLQSVLTELYGVRPEVITDNNKVREYEIRIGSTKRTYSASYAGELETCGEYEGLLWFESDGTVCLGGASVYAVRNAVRAFIGSVSSAEVDETSCAWIPTTDRHIGDAAATYSTMSYNILYSIKTGDTRAKTAVDFLLRELPDTIGIQECSETWYEILTSGLGEYYGVVGELNSTKTQRWRNPVFYRKDRFRLIETKTQWLSSTPSTSSKLPDSPQYRILTYAVLEDIATGERFVHCNTHMEYTEAARQPQFGILIQLLDKIDYPMVLTGDFNTTSTTQYFAMVENAGYQNSYDMTDRHDMGATYPSSGSVIDFCFVTPDTVNVKTHEIFDEENQNQELSDHTPVLVTFTLFP